MKKKKIILLTILLLVLLIGKNNISAAEADSYICTAEKSIGDKYDKKLNKCKEEKFNVDGKIYILTREKKQIAGRKVAWIIKEYNKHKTAFICEDDFNPLGNLFDLLDSYLF